VARELLLRGRPYIQISRLLNDIIGLSGTKYKQFRTQVSRKAGFVDLSTSFGVIKFYISRIV